MRRREDMVSDACLVAVGAILLLAGFVGCFLPVLPGVACSYAALLVLLPTSHAPSVARVATAGAIAVAVLVLDYIVPAIGAKRFNCSRWGIFGCMAGTVVGIFFAPAGILLGPFLGAIAGELVAGKAAHEALRGGFGALLGFLFGMALKLAACALFAWWFVQACLAG